MPRFRRPRHPVHALRRALAGLLAVVALVLALHPPPPAGAASPRPAGVPVVAAAADLAPGTVLGHGDLTVLQVPVAAAPAGSFRTVGSVVGRTLAGGVRAREPVTDARVTGAGLTALLPAGLVAAPVRLADLAVAVLVSPGDRVDVLATAPDAPSAELVATRALVLAAPARAGPSGDRTSAGDAGVLLLAVDPPTAARLAAASTTSTVTVSLAPS